MICIGQKCYHKALELLHNVGELSLVQQCFLIIVKFAIDYLLVVTLSLLLFAITL
ncbi:hypothetical protein RHGRI_036706 [Rhododendron griersonianum]|uniref:Uncharacterized protein n=1 Tax=Rhododendron griersonianum TaxID=479676 RepID=A0AAV6HPH3_9ERIC|nr:hypothetical protein RHGRI_036706 [Rhododendron griersonianum]